MLLPEGGDMGAQQRERPVFSGGTVEALTWNIWDWASHEWVSLNVYGPGFEGCRV